MDFIKQFFGDHTIGFHLAGLLFCLIGAGLIKRHYWLKHKAQCSGVCDQPEWSSSKWFKSNWQDFLTSILVAFIVVRFIDIALHAIELESIKMFGFEIPITSDTVFYYLLFGALVQIALHKWYRPKRKSKELNPQGTVNPNPPPPPNPPSL